jgi:hypothetical protein
MGAMLRRLLAALVVPALAAVPACRQENPAYHAGAGGTGGATMDGAAGKGGSGDGGAKDGADANGDADGGASCGAPACITDLYKDCTPSGSCMIDGVTNDTCWSNGVQLCGGSVDVSGLMFSTTITFYKADGRTLCFTADLTGSLDPVAGSDAAPLQAMFTLKDATGMTVATGMGDLVTSGASGGSPAPSVVSVMCGGKSYDFDSRACSQLSLRASDGSPCTSGACSCP